MFLIKEINLVLFQVIGMRMEVFKLSLIAQSNKKSSQQFLTIYKIGQMVGLLQLVGM